MKIYALAAAALLALTISARADIPGAHVIPGGTCGSTSPFPTMPSLISSAQAWLFVDANGLLCTNASGGSTGAGTIGQPVPSSGSYTAYNLSGTLTGETGNAFGMYFDVANGSNLLTALQNGTGATGSAVPSSAIYFAGVNGGNLTGIAVDSSGRIITSNSGASTNSHAQTSALAATLVAKNVAGTLFGFYCSAITGGTTGYCVVQNTTTAATTGAVTPLDICYFTTIAGCSFSRLPIGVAYGTGISVTISSNTTPYSITTGTLTGFIGVDYQ